MVENVHYWISRILSCGNGESLHISRDYFNDGPLQVWNVKFGKYTESCAIGDSGEYTFAESEAALRAALVAMYTRHPDCIGDVA